MPRCLSGVTPAADRSAGCGAFSALAATAAFVVVAVALSAVGVNAEVVTAPPPPPTATGGLIVNLPPRIEKRIIDESLRDEECWNNGPNLTYAAAVSCSLTDAHAYTLVIGGIGECCLNNRSARASGASDTVALGSEWVHTLDMATQDLWIDTPTIPYSVRGYTACGMSREQLVLTNASADANSPTGPASEVYYLNKQPGGNWELATVAQLKHPRRRAAMADTYNYTYIFGGVDADGKPVTFAERRPVGGGDFEVFAPTYPVCDCAVAIHDIEIFIVCSNCSSQPGDDAGQRNLFYTICLEKNEMRPVSGWVEPPGAGPIVSVSGAAIAQYAIFLVFYENNINPVVNYWDLYLEQLHQITTEYLSVPRTHGSAFVSQASLWYAGGLYFPAPGVLTDTLVNNTDSVPVMQNYKFDPANSPDWVYRVGEPISILCEEGFFFRLAETPRCLTPVMGTEDAVPCRGTQSPISLYASKPATAYGCMSKGTCDVPMGQRRRCGPPGIDFRVCNRQYGCCYDSNASLCFQYEAPQPAQRLYYQCAELYPLVIQAAPSTPSPGSSNQPLTAGPGPTPTVAAPPSAATKFMRSSMGQVVIAAVGVVLVATVAAGAWLLHQRNARRRLGGTGASGPGGNADLDVIHGKYHVTRKLGQGGFGSVYLVTRKTDLRQFALKYIPCNDDEDRAFALKEFELVRQSQGHPNMITIHDMFMNWEDDEVVANAAINGTPRVADPADNKRAQEAARKAALASPLLNPNRRFVCIVMTYLPGGDLAHYIVHSLRTGVRIPQEWILQVLARQMVSVLDHLHNRPMPIVHRDLKPENVLLTTDRGQIILTDFGLAQEQMNTYMSTRAGSLHYVAPECWKKHYSSAVDMWAVGCILYATATGRATAGTARVMFHDAKERGFVKEIRDELTVGSGHRYTDEFATFVLAFLQVDHKRRLVAQAALSWLDDMKDGVPRRTPSRSDMNSSGPIAAGGHSQTRAQRRSTRSSTASASSPLAPSGGTVANPARSPTRTPSGGYMAPSPADDDSGGGAMAGAPSAEDATGTGSAVESDDREPPPDAAHPQQPRAAMDV